MIGDKDKLCIGLGPGGFFLVATRIFLGGCGKKQPAEIRYYLQ